MQRGTATWRCLSYHSFCPSLQSARRRLCFDTGTSGPPEAPAFFQKARFSQVQEASLQRWAGWGSSDNEANIPEGICLNKQGGEFTCHLCSLAGRKGWVPGAGRPPCIPRQHQGDLRGEAGGCFPWKSVLVALTSHDPHRPSWSIPYL